MMSMDFLALNYDNNKGNPSSLTCYWDVWSVHSDSSAPNAMNITIFRTLTRIKNVFGICFKKSNSKECDCDVLITEMEPKLAKKTLRSTYSLA